MSDCLNCPHPRHEGVCGGPITRKTMLVPSAWYETEMIGTCHCESSKPTVARLRRAAKQALELDELLDACSKERLTPLLIGFDLAYLAGTFEDAADRLSNG